LKYIYLLAFLSLLTRFKILADTAPEYHVRHFTDENGLQQNSVNAITFDNMGFAWLTTAAGLMRFDGKKFIYFNKKNLPISSDRFKSFQQNPINDKLYAETDYGQLLEIRDGSVISDALPVTRAELGLTLINATGLQEEKKGGFIKTQIYDHVGFKYEIIPSNDKAYYIYSGQKIAFQQYGKPSWVARFPGRMSYVRNDIAWDIKTDHAYLRGTKSVNNFMVLNGQLFYHNRGIGDSLLHITPQKQTVLHLGGEILQNPVYEKLKVKVRIIINRITGQSFAYLNRHLYLIEYNSQKGKPDTKLLISDFDAEANKIGIITYDKRTGVILLGSESMGLFVLTPKLFRTIHLPSAEEDNIYYAHVPYSASAILTPQGNVMAVNKIENHTIIKIKGDIPSAKQTQVRDRQGNIWVRKVDKVYLFCADSKMRDKVWDIKKEPVRLYQGLKDGIWIGFKDGTLSYLDPNKAETDSAEVIARVKKRVTFLHQTDHNNIWIGTASGMYNLNLATKKTDAVSGLDGKDIRSIHSTKKGEVWITTYGDGYFLLKGKNVTALPVDANGYLNHAHCIVEDKNQNFWITTNKGLFKASKKDLLHYAMKKTSYVYYKYYDKNDGFATNEFNGGCQPCAAQLANGYISLPSMNGLVWFKPASKKDQLPESVFIVQNLNIDGVITKFKKIIMLPHNYKYLDIQLATPNFTNSHNVIMFYKLEKVGDETESKWNRMDENQNLKIYNLSHGKYTLVIRKVIGFNDQYIEKKLVLDVATPWFLQWWFFILIVMSLTFLVFICIKLRTHYLAKQNRELGILISERTANLSKAMYDLEISEKTLERQLQIQMRIIGVLSHDMHTPLRYLTRHIPELFEQIRPSLTDSYSLRLSKSIEQSTERVYLLTDNLLKFIKTTFDKGGEIDKELVIIPEILEAKSGFFSDIAYENQTTISVNADPHLTVNSSRQMLEIVIHNLLDNAVKSTWKDKITLTAKRYPEFVRITVADTGGGMPAEIVNWLGKAVEVSSTDYDPNSFPNNIGLGLIIVKEVTQLLSIHLSVRSDKEGTEIHLDFSNDQNTIH
jgi:signal transduction histidine kinase